MCAALAGLCAAAAQKQSTGPRALAVLQTDTRGQRRLLPIAIQVEGRFYDAGIYKASPLPMALEPGTVYEVEQNGDPLGLFTIEQARPAANGSWLATGQWQDKHAIEEAKRKAAPPPQPKTDKADTEDRPVLRKSPRASPTAGAPPASTPTGGPAPNTAPPPTMGTPAETSSGSAPGSPAKPASAPSAPPDDANVPGRPVLRRGKHEDESSSDIGAPGGTRPGALAAAKTSPRLRYLAAISDADGPEPRSYIFAAKPGEQSEFRAKVIAMAQAAVAAYEKSRRPSFASAQIAPNEFRMFDLDYSNQPVMVLTASARIVDRSPRRRAGPAAAKPQPAPDAIVTMVARQDIYGELQPVFSSVTDARHLDEFPRLELIDAVDADGDGRGELLFRESTDSNTGWVIYKAGMDKLSRLFDTFAPSD